MMKQAPMNAWRETLNDTSPHRSVPLMTVLEKYDTGKQVELSERPRLTSLPPAGHNRIDQNSMLTEVEFSRRTS